MSDKKKNSPVPEEIPSHHWADHAAEDLLKKHPGKESFVCASGISPSGMVHIGNFREVITVDLVVRALRERGKKVRFLYSWDEYDAFRKVPANLPQPELLKANLRRPLAKVPSPFGDGSYAGHFEKEFEGEIGQLGIAPDFIYQAKRYEACDYAEGIATALRNQKTIVEILNRHRTEPLPANWWCVSVYDSETGRDTTTVLDFKEPSTLVYRCDETKKEKTLDFSKEPGAKLLWRVDWPMRWHKERVDFEPGGKDHSTTGGSYETGAEILRAVWKAEPPHYVQYDFVLAKGLGSKLSSSTGNLITLAEALEIYEPAVIRWLFASRKPNLDFAIAFDLDVMKAYDEFDRTERFAYGVEEGDEKKVTYERRIYELSVVTFDPAYRKGAMPAQYGFRHLCNLLQIHEGNPDRAEAALEAEGATVDRARFRSRAVRAWKWLESYAPEEFKFKLRADDEAMPKTTQPAAVKALVDFLRDTRATEAVITDQLRGIMQSNGVEPKVFFQELYRLLINKSHGPKLASFFLAIGPKRAAALLERALP